MKNIINVFWTGGLDSTYLVVKLLSMGITVQPYYIIDSERKSLKKELSAIERISECINRCSTMKGDLLPAIIIRKECIKTYPDITNLVVGVMMEQRGKVVHTLEGKDLVKQELNGLEVFTTKELLGLNHDAFVLYENILFPTLLVGKKKTEEWEELHQLGFGDVAEMTWFCHHPILGMTCGHCNPCQDALNEGIAFRVSKLGYTFGAIGHFLYDPFKNKH